MKPLEKRMCEKYQLETYETNHCDEKFCKDCKLWSD